MPVGVVAAFLKSPTTCRKLQKSHIVHGLSPRRLSRVFGWPVLQLNLGVTGSRIVVVRIVQQA